MATVRTFRALRPRADLAAQIAAIPYDVVNTDEARQVAAGNPLSFLHVSRAEIDLPPGTNPYENAVYARAAANFSTLKQTSMVQEESPSMYFYRLRMGSHTQTGLAACYSLDEYDQGIIKKHEKTRKDKEDDRTTHMLALRAQTGPVFLTYRNQPDLDALAEEACSGEPLYDFVAADGIAHTIWRVDDAAIATGIVSGFASLPALYIADGHHRAASAARARARLDSEQVANAPDPQAWFLAVAFPDSQTQILPYNRVVKDLAGLTPDEFLEALKTRADVRSGGALPSQKGECGMFLDGRWYTIALSPQAGTANQDAIASLDVTLLQESVLEPLLKVVDQRTDKRIDFVGGVRGIEELERAVSSGAAAVAFSMYPVTVDELMTIADAGSIMPPKSTWFEPKLRDGLLNHLI